MKLQFPWAKRKHYHGDPSFLKYTTCSKCRHVLLTGHVDNKRVQVIDRRGGGTITHNEIYGVSCAPGYDRKEIAINGKIRFYKEGNEVDSDIEL